MERGDLSNRVVPTKRCGRCQTDRPRSEFHRDSSRKDGLQSACKSCSSDRLREWVASNEEHVRRRRRKYNAEHLEQGRVNARATRLRTVYGISVKQYDAMLEQQGHRCAICDKTCTSGRRLAVDHDHATGQVRGLLCGNCNRGIGYLKDSQEILAAASAYLANGGVTCSAEI